MIPIEIIGEIKNDPKICYVEIDSSSLKNAGLLIQIGAVGKYHHYKLNLNEKSEEKNFVIENGTVHRNQNQLTKREYQSLQQLFKEYDVVILDYESFLKKNAFIPYEHQMPLIGLTQLVENHFCLIKGMSDKLSIRRNMNRLKKCGANVRYILQHS